MKRQRIKKPEPEEIELTTFTEYHSTNTSLTITFHVTRSPANHETKSTYSLTTPKCTNPSIELIEVKPIKFTPFDFSKIFIPEKIGYLDKISEETLSGVKSAWIPNDDHTHLLKLPPELWLLIFSCIADKDLAMVTQVSRLWHNLTRAPNLLTRLRTAKEKSKFKILPCSYMHYVNTSPLYDRLNHNEGLIHNFNREEELAYRILPDLVKVNLPNLWNEHRQQNPPPPREHPGIPGQNNGFRMR